MNDTSYQTPKYQPTTFKMVEAMHLRLGDVYCTFSKGEIKAIGYIITTPHEPRISERQQHTTMTYVDFISSEIVSMSLQPKFLIHILRYDETLPPLK